MVRGSTEYPDIGKRGLADEGPIAAVGRSGQVYKRNGGAAKGLAASAAGVTTASARRAR